MMGKRVSDLTGMNLDYWVARAEGLDRPFLRDGSCWEHKASDLYYEGDGRAHMATFCPSSEWEDGGPIIGRKLIQLTRDPNYQSDATWHARIEGFTSYADDSALVAAMRAYVSSVFGDEVSEE